MVLHEFKFQPQQLHAPEHKMSRAKLPSEPKMPIEEANALLDTVSWELLESSHAGLARKQLLGVMKRIHPDLQDHEAAIKALQIELDYKADHLLDLKKQNQKNLDVTALQDDVDFLKVLLQEKW